MAQSGAEAAEAAHMAGTLPRRKPEEREREVDEEGPKCNIIEIQGPHCNELITFKLVLRWRWT
jgi:hypothetical protein